MAKWYGKVGYETMQEVEPGVWVPSEVVEHNYYGDSIKYTQRVLTTADGVNDDIRVVTSISIIADPFAYDNFTDIKYVEYMGVKWKVTTAEVQRPRIVLSLGGRWNENAT